MLSPYKMLIINGYSDTEIKRLACSKVILYGYGKLFITPEESRIYHSNQSVQSSIFFQFESYCISKINEYVGVLNLTLNAKFNVYTWVFQMRHPINIIQKFHFDPQSYQEQFVNEIYGVFCDGYFREIENETNLQIPTVIGLVIKRYNKVGAADFYCETFKNPRFDYVEKRWLAQNCTPCDDKIDNV